MRLLALLALLPCSALAASSSFTLNEKVYKNYSCTFVDEDSFSRDLVDLPSKLSDREAKYSCTLLDRSNGRVQVTLLVSKQHVGAPSLAANQAMLYERLESAGCPHLASPLDLIPNCGKVTRDETDADCLVMPDYESKPAEGRSIESIVTKDSEGRKLHKGQQLEERDTLLFTRRLAETLQCMHANRVHHGLLAAKSAVATPDEASTSSWTTRYDPDSLKVMGLEQAEFVAGDPKKTTLPKQIDFDMNCLGAVTMLMNHGVNYVDVKDLAPAEKWVAGSADDATAPVPTSTKQLIWSLLYGSGADSAGRRPTAAEVIRSVDTILGGNGGSGKGPKLSHSAAPVQEEERIFEPFFWLM